MNKYQLGISAINKIKKEIEIAYKSKNPYTAYVIVAKLKFDINRDARNIINLLTKHDNKKTIAKKEQQHGKKSSKKSSEKSY